MTTIVTRSGKGSALTTAEMDANLTNLNTDKVETTRVVGGKSGELTVTNGGALTTDIELGLANSGVAAGTINSSTTQLTPCTIDAKGRVTNVGTPQTIAPAFASLTGKPTTLAGYGISDAQAAITGAASTITSSNLTASRALVADGSGKVAVSSVTATTLGYLDATSSVQGQLNAKQSTAAKDQASGYAGLDANAKLADSVLPPLAVTEYLGEAANESAMLALSGTKGDWCVRTDSGLVWVVIGSNPALLASWAPFSYPGTPVKSVASKTGAVTLTAGDVGLGSVSNDPQLKIAANLADLNNAGTARSNLGLGDSATKSVGSTAGTVAAGDHGHSGVYEPVLTQASQAEMEAGAETAVRSMSPFRVKQAITALGGGSGSGGTPVTLWVFDTAATNGSFTPPATGLYEIEVIGAGGGGAVAMGSTGALGATGGAAGGRAFKRATLSSSTTYTYNVGTGGGGGSRSSAGATNGSSGGQSNFSGSGLTTLTANGGAGGIGTTSSSTQAGASGGTATGGDLNVQGGSSGSVTGAGRKATGGGAVGLFGTGYASGNASSSSTGYYACTGGAGVGGKSGAATATSANTASAGGGAGSASADSTNALSQIGGSALPFPLSVWPTVTGAGGASGTAGGMGGGSGGGMAAVGSSGLGGANGAMLGSVGSGAAGRYGSGGGAVIAASNTGTFAGGAGGDGLIVIRRIV